MTNCPHCAQTDKRADLLEEALSNALAVLEAISGGESLSRLPAGEYATQQHNIATRLLWMAEKQLSAALAAAEAGFTEPFASGKAHAA